MSDSDSDSSSGSSNAVSDHDQATHDDPERVRYTI